MMISTRTGIRTAAALVCGLALLTAPAHAQTEPPPPPPPPVDPAPPPPPVDPPITPPAEAPRADLPTAKQIVDDAREAMGGKDKLDAITSFSVKATLAAPMAELNFDVKSKKTGSFHLVQSVTGRPAASTVIYDGEVAWVEADDSHQLVEDAALDQGKQQFEMLFPYWMVFRPQDHFKEMLTVDQADFQGHNSYKVKFVREDDGELQRYGFFDVDEKTLRGIRFVQDSPFGPITVDFELNDWKEVGDVKVFTRLTIDQFGQETSLVYNEVEFNKVDDSTFRRPDEVQELVNKRAAEAAQPPPADPSDPAPTPPPAPATPPTAPPPPPPDSAG